jgi:hypothetical protein
MSTSIPAVANNKANVTSAEFVQLVIYNNYLPTYANSLTSGQEYIIKTTGNTAWTTIGATSNVSGTIFTANANVANTTGTADEIELLTFSSAYTAESIDGNVYTPLGGLMSVGVQNRSLRVTSADTSIAISGVSGNNIYEVLESQGQIRGGLVKIYRGFYNSNMVLNNAYLRFTGIVTNYGISEEREDQLDNYTISFDCSSYKSVLENRIAGRKTNKESWQFFDSTDSAMNNVTSLAGFTFDFGVDPKTKTTVPSAGGGAAAGGAGGNFQPGMVKSN